MRAKIMMMLIPVMLLTTTANNRAGAQSTAQDIRQLVLDIEKLTQLKGILSDLRTGYRILSQGYDQVSDIAAGNFKLHAAFLNSLETVSPAVRRYGRIAAIAETQAEIVSECEAAFAGFKRGGYLRATELLYLNRVFAQLLSQSAANIGDLLNVITAGTLRMSDGERIGAIDRVYADTANKLVFLQHFDNEVMLLQAQRAKERNDVNSLKRLFAGRDVR